MGLNNQSDWLYTKNKATLIKFICTDKFKTLKDLMKTNGSVHLKGVFRNLCYVS